MIYFHLSFFCHQQEAKCDDELITRNPISQKHFLCKIVCFASIFQQQLNGVLKQVYFIGFIELFSKSHCCLIAKMEKWSEAADFVLLVVRNLIYH